MTNACIPSDWRRRADGDERAMARSFDALSPNANEAANFGIDTAKLGKTPALHPSASPNRPVETAGSASKEAKESAQWPVRKTRDHPRMRAP
jgi:hypothetical protein